VLSSSEELNPSNDGCLALVGNETRGNRPGALTSALVRGRVAAGSMSGRRPVAPASSRARISIKREASMGKDGRVVARELALGVIMCLVCFAAPAVNCPEFVGQWGYDHAYDVASSGGFGHFGDGTSLLTADVSNPVAPQVVGGVVLPQEVIDIEIVGEPPTSPPTLRGCGSSTSARLPPRSRSASTTHPAEPTTSACPEDMCILLIAKRDSRSSVGARSSSPMASSRAELRLGRPRRRRCARIVDRRSSVERVIAVVWVPGPLYPLRQVEGQM